MYNKLWRHWDILTEPLCCLTSVQNISDEAPASDSLRSPRSSALFREMSTFLQGSSPVIHKSSLLRSTVTGRRTSCFDVRGERRSPEFIYLVVYMSTMLHWQARVFLNYYWLESHIVVKFKTGTPALYPRQYVKGETCTVVFLFIHSWLSLFDTFLCDFISCFSDTDISFQMVK